MDGHEIYGYLGREQQGSILPTLYHWQHISSTTLYMSDNNTEAFVQSTNNRRDLAVCTVWTGITNYFINKKCYN